MACCGSERKGNQQRAKESSTVAEIFTNAGRLCWKGTWGACESLMLNLNRKRVSHQKLILHTAAPAQTSFINIHNIDIILFTSRLYSSLHRGLNSSIPNSNMIRKINRGRKAARHYMDFLKMTCPVVSRELSRGLMLLVGSRHKLEQPRGTGKCDMSSGHFCAQQCNPRAHLLPNGLGTSLLNQQTEGTVMTGLDFIAPNDIRVALFSNREIWSYGNLRQTNRRLYAKRLRITAFQISQNKVNHRPLIFSPGDMSLCVASTQLHLKKALLTLCPHGRLNIHPSNVQPLIQFRVTVKLEIIPGSTVPEARNILERTPAHRRAHILHVETPTHPTNLDRIEDQLSTFRIQPANQTSCLPFLPTCLSPENDPLTPFQWGPA